MSEGRRSGLRFLGEGPELDAEFNQIVAAIRPPQQSGEKLSNAPRQFLPGIITAVSPKTAVAIEEARRGGLKKFSTIKDLMADLNEDN
jgi:hypothetical protein